MPKAAIIMGSKSDFDVVKPAYDILKKFGVDTSVRVISAHRTPLQAAEFAESAVKNGFEVIIAAAGKAAHLGGVIASLTPLPVIGIPVKSSTLDGLDSLLSTVQMPSGVPVACVAVNGSENAGLLAVQILSLKYPALTDGLIKYKKSLADKIADDDKKLQAILASEDTGR
ncbi:MAG: 5-(carboxyamino)imidazole ribonucleotide mutase [Clostridiales bacterium]|jgi:5-(carboxyamino)imidazole ribonucleotide mutase|nr:5-(carboxyamino)imidazole ribonucleotide mutase [Clostridiales bacterium]